MDDKEAIKIAIDNIMSRLAAVEDKVYEQTFTTVEAAKFLGCSRQTVTKYRNMGLINPIIGTTRFTISELNRVKNKRKQ